MSSASFIYNSRRFNLDLPKQLQRLIAKFNEKITDDANDDGSEELQIRSEGGIGRSYLKFCDSDLVRLDNSLTQTILDTIQSCPTFEPDHNQCKLIIEFNNTGGFVPDTSGFGHNAKTFGVNRMQWGIRYGWGALSLETIYDGRTNYSEIPDDTDLSFVNTDFTLMFRFAPFDLTMSSVHKQVVICKKHNSTEGAYYSFELGTDGSATFSLVLSSTTKYSATIPAGTIIPTAFDDMDTDSPRYDVVVTYDYLNTILKLYINNYDFSSYVVNTIPTDSNVPDYDGYDIMIGRWTSLAGRPITLPQILDVDPIRLFSKLYFGVFQQLKYWKGRILTPTEITNHYTNKITIEACPFGEVAIPNGVLVLV
jgi:hypothetical protein